MTRCCVPLELEPRCLQSFIVASSVLWSKWSTIWIPLPAVWDYSEMKWKKASKETVYWRNVGTCSGQQRTWAESLTLWRAVVTIEGLTKMYKHRSVAIFFHCPAIRYGGFFNCGKKYYKYKKGLGNAYSAWYGGSGIHVTSTIFWENITLHTVHYISVQLCGYVCR
jgi:hypothetical protein